MTCWDPDDARRRGGGAEQRAVTVTIKVEVPTLADLAPAVARCAQPESEQPKSDDGPGGDRGVALLLDAELRDDAPPYEPGIYVWSDPRGAVVYIGSATGKSRGYLAGRLGEETDWVENYDPLGDWWKPSVVHVARTHHATPRWARATDTQSALEAERRLIEWHRSRAGIAPIAVGWDAQKGSPRERAETWAHALWDETIPGTTADPRAR